MYCCTMWYNCIGTAMTVYATEITEYPKSESEINHLVN